MKSTNNYIYLSSKIRALEPQILDETDIERMVDAPDLASAFKVLNDTDYGDNLLELEPTDYREALARDFKQLFDFLQKNVPDLELFQLILLERDFVNIRLFFKAKYFKVDIDEFLNENATYPKEHLKDFIYENHTYAPEVIKAYLDEKKGQVLDQRIKDVIYRVDKQITEKTRPDEIDALLTQEYYNTAIALADELGSKFIKNYFMLEIDTNNILIWLRARRLELDKDRLKQKMIRGGHADIARMLNSYPDDLKVLKPFINANFDMHVVRAYDEFIEKDTLFEFEKATKDYLTRYMQMAKNFSYGPEVVFSYWYAKRKAINNIRIILTGKMSGIPAEAIKQTLRVVY